MFGNLFTVRASIEHLPCISYGAPQKGVRTPTDQEIREMCARALVAHGAKFDAAIVELQVALRNRIAEISNLAVAALLKMPTPALTDDTPPRAEEKKKTGSEP